MEELKEWLVEEIKTLESMSLVSSPGSNLNLILKTKIETYKIIRDGINE